MWTTAILSCAWLATLVVGQISDGLPPVNAVNPDADNERRQGRGRGRGGRGRPSPDPNALPVVDTGRQVQQATEFDNTTNLYSFNNIRYGEPPVGDLRFAAPVAAKHDRTMQTGETERICHQAAPAWGLISETFVRAYLSGDASAMNGTAAPALPGAGGGDPASQLPAADPRETEDCLFLDVVVPKKLFDERGKGKGAPVLVWIHGGGYVFGSKSGAGNPAGLIARSQDASAQGVVYVQLNYRLGAFGWLSGSTLESNGGVSNAGLLDQRLALEWVERNIRSFGGDPRKVTVFGVSAGGGSIQHHITANGGKGGVPFDQAVVQSPAFQPITREDQKEKILQDYLKLLKVSTVAEARAKSELELRVANAIQVGLSPYGQFVYGPVVDGKYVPDLPGKLLLQGSFIKRLKIMAGHNTNEGLVFTSPFVRTDDQYINFLKENLPSASSETIDFIAKTLYPPTFDGSAGYKDQIMRTASTLADLGVSCNTNYLGRAYGNNTYNYLFSVPPALHGQDTPYTFYNGPNPLVSSEPVAVALQNYITSFAMSGSPNEEGVPVFNLYGKENEVQSLNGDQTNAKIEEVKDPAADERCSWWQQGLYA
ncbi:MAG: hypothetical protein M1823_002848 [Watsoniomyces obsoletus]|nr:MAG: hypothetical protein M1823_002848 [Watsoniomyces obsoletus]